MHLPFLMFHMISIHALREEGDFYWIDDITTLRAFLSTPSARRATWSTGIPTTPIKDFYPRPPRGGRRVRSSAQSECRPISIHALREEGDRSAIKGDASP